MADIELILGADTGSPVADTLRQAYPKVNRNFARLNHEMNNHMNAVGAHHAQNITYTGTVAGATDVKEAIDIVKSELNQAVIEGDSGPEAQAARVSSSGATYPTLVDRLNDEREQTVAQFTENRKQMRLIEGMEYLFHFHDMVRLGYPVTCVASGDSTTDGVGITDTNYEVHNLIKRVLNGYGVRSVNSINAGHSNMRTPQWESEYLAEDMAQNPNLYVLRWGLNDGAHTPKEERLQVFTDALRGGLETLRASKAVNEMSVILMMPNSTNDPTYGRDAEWFDAIYPVIRQAARDFQCCFVDTYHFLMDSTNVIWQDEPMGIPGVHIHPLDTGNAWIVSLLEDALVPVALRKFGITNRISTDEVKHAMATPSTYPYGVSVYRTQAGFPFDGMVTTIHGMDGVLLQYNNGLWNQTTESIAIRRGLSVTGVPGGLGDDAWGPWLYVRNSEEWQSLPLSNGWENYGSGNATAQFMKDASGNVEVKAMVKSGTTTGGTVIATLPSGYRPLESFYHPILCNGSPGFVQIQSGGNIVAINISSNAWVDFGRIIFKDEQ